METSYQIRVMAQQLFAELVQLWIGSQSLLQIMLLERKFFCRDVVQMLVPEALSSPGLPGGQKIQAGAKSGFGNAVYG